MYSILFVLTSVSDMKDLYRNVAFSILVLSIKKRYPSFLKKGFRFPENLFLNESIENLQSFY